MFELPLRYAEEIVAHAREEAPNECCGILAGKDGRVFRLYRAVNAEHSPYRFDIDARERHRIHADVQAAGWQFLAIYHSHPAGQARPSTADIALARVTAAGENADLWPGVVHLIVSLADDLPVLRAFRLDGGAAVEEELHFVD
ncbi:MAG: M67 family metallopeptidase [Dehalococcoidia bacterium]|jgi:proteasome lid subunit RPN8/RPN11